MPTRVRRNRAAMTATLTKTTPERIDVPQPLSEAQVRFFVENGYLAVPSLVTRDEVEALRRDTVDLARGKYPCASLQPLPEEMSDDEALRNILCIHQPHFVSPIVEQHVRHPHI